MRAWLRADGSPVIGFGHVMRLVAVAEEARARGIPSTFLTATPQARPPLRARGFDVALVEEGPQCWLDQLEAGDLVVFDGYGFGPELFATAAKRLARVGVVEDIGYGEFPVDVVLNQNLVPHTDYRLAPATRVLSGPRYALIRREFVARRRSRAGSATRLLLTFGGSDPAGLAPQAMRVATRQPRPFREIQLLVGPGASPSTYSGSGLQVVTDPTDVGAVFDRCDVALAAAGTTTWELLGMGLAVGLIQVADNQEAVAGPLAAHGAALFVGRAPVSDDAIEAALLRLAQPDERRRLSRAGMALVDGRGAARFLDALLSTDRGKAPD